MSILGLRFARQTLQTAVRPFSKHTDTLAKGALRTAAGTTRDVALHREPPKSLLPLPLHSTKASQPLVTASPPVATSLVDMTARSTLCPPLERKHATITATILEKLENTEELNIEAFFGINDSLFTGALMDALKSFIGDDTAFYIRINEKDNPYNKQKELVYISSTPGQKNWHQHITFEVHRQMKRLDVESIVLLKVDHMSDVAGI